MSYRPCIALQWRTFSPATWLHHPGYGLDMLSVSYRREWHRTSTVKCLYALHWRHNESDGVSNHQPHDCLLNGLFRRRSKKTPKLRVTGRWPVNSPHKGPVTRKIFPLDDVIIGVISGILQRWDTVTLLHFVQRNVLPVATLITARYIWHQFHCDLMSCTSTHKLRVLLECLHHRANWRTGHAECIIQREFSISSSVYWNSGIFVWITLISQQQLWQIACGFMMTSSNGNIFRVTGHLSGEFTGHRGALMIYFICVWINNRVSIREAGDLRRYRTHYDVIVMLVGPIFFYTIFAALEINTQDSV